jgi:hypothetical protein
MTGWLFESLAWIDDSILGTESFGEDAEAARLRYESAMDHAEEHGGAGRLVNNGKTWRYFSFRAKND